MSAGDEIRGLVGALLVGCGLVVALLCGTCSGTFGFLSAATAVTGRGLPFSFTWPFLLAGVAAVAAGVGLIAVGERVSCGAPASPPQDKRESQ